jgi:hypothetical protein
MPNSIDSAAVEGLRLDPDNPRLPESVRGGQQAALLRWLFENGNLEEIAQSMVDNGFFQHEPLIVLRDARKRSGIVLEGNRRLAALKVLLGTPEAEGLQFLGIDLPRTRAAQLRNVPCYFIAERDDVHAFLGFRHIGGIEPWGPEAKARYLAAEVDRLVAAGSKDPFREVGRRVGSNAQGVRNPYVAIKILEVARTEFGLDAQYIQLNRFGVWLRCMNSEEIRSFIGLGSPRSFDDVKVALESMREESLRQVLRDLTPPSTDAKALLADSRDVTDYGRVLANKRALAVLRKHRRLDAAIQLLRQADLAERIREVSNTVRILIDELSLSDIEEEVPEAVDELFALARSARDIAKSRNSEDE